MASAVSVTIAVRRMSSEVLMRGVRSWFMPLTASSPPAPVGTRFAARACTYRAAQSVSLRGAFRLSLRAYSSVG